MHKLAIPQSVVDRVVKRHGREHVHEDFDPAKTALVVVDMQNAFMLPGVAHSPCLMAQEIVPNINRLAQGVRDIRLATTQAHIKAATDTVKERREQMDAVLAA